jgi:cell division inhibitor SepF
VTNLLGKLKNMIGTNQDDLMLEQEAIDMTDEEMKNLYEEAIPMEDEEMSPPSSSSSTRYQNRDRSRFQMDLPSESLINNDPISSNIPNNVIEMPGVENAMNEVVVIEPHSFDEIPQVIKTLKERRCVVLNLNVMEPDEAQRAVDFVAGGTFAIDGHQERIGESIFLFTPKSVKVSTLNGNSEKSQSQEPFSNLSRSSFSSSLWDDQNTSLAQ